MILGQVLSLQYVLVKTTTHARSHARTCTHTQYGDTSKAGHVHLATTALYTDIQWHRKKEGGGVVSVKHTTKKTCCFVKCMQKGRERTLWMRLSHLHPTTVLRSGTLVLGRSGSNQDNSLGTHALDVVTLGSLCLSGGDQDPSKKLLSSRLWCSCDWLAPESKLDQPNYIVHIACIHTVMHGSHEYKFWTDCSSTQIATVYLDNHACNPPCWFKQSLFWCL